MKAAWVIVAGLLFAVPSFADELKLYAAAGVKSPVTDIAAEYEAASGQKITLIFDTAGGAAKRFNADGSATFLVTGQSRIDKAQQAGDLQGGTTLPLGDTVAGFAAAPGAVKPDISTAEKFRAALLAAPSIAFSDPARGATVGTHFLKVIEALGIKDEILKKATLAVDGVQTMRLVQDGKAALGITQISEIVQADPKLLVGPFPGEFDLATTYSLWYRNSASAVVHDFARFLALPASRARLAADGLRAPAS